MASSNKAFEAAARDVSVFPRQIYDCCTAINFKSVFIPVTFIGIIADVLYPVKNMLMNTQSVPLFFKTAFKQMHYSLFLPARVWYFLLISRIAGRCFN